MTDATDPRQGTDGTFVIGAVGHRELEGNPEAIANRIAAVLAQIAAEHADFPVSLLSSVAEGADRLLLAAAAEHGIPYVCALPCAPDCFREDFSSPDSSSEFDQLLESARAIVMPTESIDKESGYLWASNYVLDRADVLVAVWDGAPGHGPAGTAETVSRALKQGLPVIWIPTHVPHTVRMLGARASAIG